MTGTAGSSGLCGSGSQAWPLHHNARKETGLRNGDGKGGADPEVAVRLTLTCAAADARPPQPRHVSLPQPPQAPAPPWRVPVRGGGWYVVQRRTDAGEAEMKNNAT